MSETPHLDKGPEQPSGEQGSAPPPPNPYGAGPVGSPYDTIAPGAPWGRPPDHPQATIVLVLGILSIVVCQLTGPFAWVIGKRALAEIDASGGQVGGRSQTQIGYILGIVGTVLLGLALAVLVVYVVIFVVFLASVPSTT